jgi:hypothetical protein
MRPGLDGMQRRAVVAGGLSDADPAGKARAVTRRRLRKLDGAARRSPRPAARVSRLASLELAAAGAAMPPNRPRAALRHAARLPRIAASRCARRTPRLTRGNVGRAQRVKERDRLGPRRAQRRSRAVEEVGRRLGNPGRRPVASSVEDDGSPPQQANELGAWLVDEHRRLLMSPRRGRAAHMGECLSGAARSANVRSYPQQVRGVVAGLRLRNDVSPGHPEPPPLDVQDRGGACFRGPASITTTALATSLWKDHVAPRRGRPQRFFGFISRWLRAQIVGHSLSDLSSRDSGE